MISIIGTWLVFLSSACTAFHLTSLSPSASPSDGHFTSSRRHGCVDQHIFGLYHVHSSPLTILGSQKNDEDPLTSSSSFVQRPGERDIDFIKRITMESESLMKKKQIPNLDIHSAPTGPVNGQNSTTMATTSPKYQRIEEWEEERKRRSEGGQLTWEERVQFDGQRFGNQVHQQWILQKHIGTFWRK
jgi:hypothetical protein